MKEFDRFCSARRAVIAGRFAHLNEMQRQAVLATEGPLLVLAGAGSGKTTVLISRVANMIRYGSASDTGAAPDWATEDDAAFLEQYAAHPNEADAPRAEKLCKLNPAAPWSILAITFTNKAAGELKDRLEKQLGPAALDVWAATFHSACVRILRRDGEAIGLPRSFTIYDSDDSLRVVKTILKEQGNDDKAFPPRMVQSIISRAKNENRTAGEFAKEYTDLRSQRAGKVYTEYEKRLRAAGALDFDDLIMLTVRLLQQHPSVRAFYEKKFRYVLVDEYQDTNHLQFLLTGLLAGQGNLCVVGDDDQSIYRFRGATIENIMNFETQYRGARVIRLEQNYRSTGNILAAANAVIANNQGRRGKTLWTGAGQGDTLRLHTAMNEHDEAQYVAGEIVSGVHAGGNWRDFAVLYRMNAQSNQMEWAMKRNGIPYRIFGGTRFFDRAEIKDMLAYLCLIHNTQDDLRLLRIINTPSRKLGQTTVETARALAAEGGVSIYDILCQARRYPALSKAAQRLGEFVQLIEGLRALLAGGMDLETFYQELLTRTGYEAMLSARDTVEDATRLENVQELRSSISQYLKEEEGEPTLGGFLDTIALFTDLDNHDAGENSVVMMTIHAAKGLEFPTVFVVGAEEGLFPSSRVIGEPEEMEEERRLAYVAMTRAKERLYMTCAAQRMLFGQTSNNRASRFTREIPETLTEQTGYGERFADYGSVTLDRGWQPAHSTYAHDAPTPNTRAQRPGGMGRGGASGPVHAPRKTTAAARRPAPLPAFGKGDVVEHKAFGRGLIVVMQPMGNDALLEIAFDEGGTKRLMLRAAAQNMTKVQ